MESPLLQSVARPDLGPLRAVPVDGPHDWWGGPLDVEGLALGSVATAAASLNRLLGWTAVQRIQSARVAASFDSPGVLRIDGAPIPAFTALSRFFPTADGWVRTHGNYPHHARLLLRALGVGHAEAVAAALASLTTRDAEARIQAAGAAAAGVRTREDWMGSPLATRTPAAQWIEAETELADHATARVAPWTPDDRAGLPLHGLRVLDLTRTIAGPISARLMAALGAEVLRVDPPKIPEIEMQHLDGDPGKYSAVADLARLDTRERVHELIASAHVLLLGYRAGSLDRFGLGSDALRERYPALVVVRLNAWGWGTPWQDRRGFDSIVQAATGIADRYRSPDGSPGALPVQALDHATGYGIFAATMTLLTARAETDASGRARLALASTADALFDLSAGRGDAQRHPDVQQSAEPLRTRSCVFGELTYAAPPFDIGDDRLDYPFAPRAYGADPLAWRDPC